jgi:HK97 family phage portal protein
MSIFDKLYPTRTMQKQEIPKIQEKGLSGWSLFSHGKKNAELFDLNDHSVILNGYNTNPYVYAVVNRLAMLAASVPIKVQKKINVEGAKSYQKMSWDEKVSRKGKILKGESLEDIPDHKLQELLDYPNDQDGAFEFRFNFFVNKLVTGNAFIEALKPTESRPPVELWNLPPLSVTINRSNNFYDKILEVYFNWHETSKTIPPELVMHSKYYNPDGDVWGLSPLSAARRAIKMVNDGEDWNVALIQNGAKPEYVIIVPEGTSLEQMEQTKRDWVDRYGGKNNVGKEPLVARGDSIKFETLGYTVKDMDWIKTELSSMRKVYDVYGVSSEIFNDAENKTQANKREAIRALYTDKVLPELDSFRDELQRWLVPMYGDDKLELTLDLTGVDALNEEKDKVAARMATSEWLTLNEKREAMGYDALDIPEFNEPWLGMNRLPVSEILITPDISEEEKMLTLKEYTNGQG